MDPDIWRYINEVGLQLLSLLDLKRYRNEFPREENLHEEWEAAVTNPGKYVNLLVGQRDGEDQRAEMDEENYYDSSPWDQKTKNFFLAYHQVKAQAYWFASRPDDAEHYKRLLEENARPNPDARIRPLTHVSVDQAYQAELVGSNSLLSILIAIRCSPNL